MGARISHEAWQRDWPAHASPPDARDRVREATFLEGHWRYGAVVHHATAEALVAALRRETDKDTRHTLFLRLFAELVNALESLGAWGWTLQQRFEFRLFLDGFLSYPIYAPRKFFEAVSGWDGDLIELLDLPPRALTIRALRGLSGEVTSRELAETFDTRLPCLKDSAEQYFKRDRALLTHYNKAKHGATMLQLAEHTRDHETDFQVIAPQLRRAEIEAGKWYDVAKFSATEEMIERSRTHVLQTTKSIQHLALLAWALHDAGLLYQRPQRG